MRGENGWRVLYLGSGDRRQPAKINLDITPVTGPDVVGGYRLPFRDGTFGAISEYMIEHVPDSEGFLAAASRALKPSGVFYLEFLFLQPLHGHPSDFTRCPPPPVSPTRWSAPVFRCVRAASMLGLRTPCSCFWPNGGGTPVSSGLTPVRRLLSYLLSWLLAPRFSIS